MHPTAPLIVNHMAAPHDTYPPNSLGAIRNCLEMAAAFIEIDVTALKSGDYLLVHDPVLEHETSGHGAVGMAEPDAVRGLVYRGTSEALALLSQVVQALVESGSSTRLQIDYKNVLPFADDEPLRRLVHLIEPLGDRVIVSTGADWQLRRLHKLAPWLDLGFDVHFYIDWRLPDEQIDPRVPPFRRGAYGYWDDHILSSERHWSTAGYLAERCETLVNAVPYASTFYIDHKLIAQSLDDGFNWAQALHGHGVKLDAWTLDVGNPVAEANAARLLSAGVDQFTTNTPRELAALLGLTPTRSP
jgi:glycerophosphoryl diester phosphodiesterase